MTGPLNTVFSTALYSASKMSADSELNETSETELFAKMVNGCQSLTVFAKKVHLRYLREC